MGWGGVGLGTPQLPNRRALGKDKDGTGQSVGVGREWQGEDSMVRDETRRELHLSEDRTMIQTLPGNS